MTESSVIIPMANMKLNNTKILIERSNKYNPRKDPKRLTGSATAGTITALRLPKNRYIIKTTRTNAIIRLLYTSSIAAPTYVALLKATSNFNPSGKDLFRSFIFALI